jgi:hypothetical protein
LLFQSVLCSQEKGELKMKRILVVSIVSVLVVIFNVWVGAAAQNERVVVLEAEVQPAITMSISSGGSLHLDPANGGIGTTSQSINIKSNQGYTLFMRANRSNLTKYNGTYDDSVCLESPLEWRTSPENAYTSIGVMDIAIAQSSTASSGDGDNITVEFRQKVGFGDAVLDDATYRIEITYTALQ